MTDTSHPYFDPRDPRTSGDDEPAGRFRLRYRQLSDGETVLCDEIKTCAEELAALIDVVPEGRERSLAMTKLEEAVMWAVKGVTS